MLFIILITTTGAIVMRISLSQVVLSRGVGGEAGSTIAKDKWMDGGMDEGMDGWMDEGMDG